MSAGSVVHSTLRYLAALVDVSLVVDGDDPVAAGASKKKRILIVSVFVRLVSCLSPPVFTILLILPGL